MLHVALVRLADCLVLAIEFVAIWLGLSGLLPVETGEVICKNRENSRFQTNEKQNHLKRLRIKDLVVCLEEIASGGSVYGGLKGKVKGEALNRQNPNCPEIILFIFFFIFLFFWSEHLPGTVDGLF